MLTNKDWTTLLAPLFGGIDGLAEIVPGFKEVMEAKTPRDTTIAIVRSGIMCGMQAHVYNWDDVAAYITLVIATKDESLDAEAINKVFEKAQKLVATIPDQLTNKSKENVEGGPDRNTNVDANAKTKTETATTDKDDDGDDELEKVLRAFLKGL